MIIPTSKELAETPIHVASLVFEGNVCTRISSGVALQSSWALRLEPLEHQEIYAFSRFFRHSDSELLSNGGREAAR